MVRRTLKAITAKISGLHEAAFWLAGFSFLSQILAFLRDRLLAHYFGAGEALDIYYTAFRIPDFIFVTIGSLVSISVLVPMFAKFAAKDESAMKSYINSIFTGFSVLMVVSCIVLFFLTPFLVSNIFRGFSAEALVQIMVFSRILLLSPLLLGLSNFFGSIVQYEKRFLLYSLSPLFYNIGIIAGTFFGADSFGVSAVVFGVIFGAAMHFLIQAGFVIFSGRSPRLTTRINLGELKETALISVPRALALSSNQLVAIAFTSAASFFGAGTVSVFNFASNLQSVPVSIVGVSYSLAAFPAISEFFARKNLEGCSRYIEESVRYIIFWTLPLSALFIVLRAQVVRVVLGSGAFDWSDTRLTAAVLALFAISFVCQSIQVFLTRAYYALGKTKLPLIINVISAVLVILLSYLLVKFFGSSLVFKSVIESFLRVSGLSGTIVLMLPLGFSLGTFISTVIFWFYFSREFSLFSKPIFRTFCQSLASALSIGLVTFLMLRVFDSVFGLETLIGIFMQAFVSGMIGILAGTFVLYLMRSEELKVVFQTIRSKARGRVVVVPESEL